MPIQYIEKSVLGSDKAATVAIDRHTGPDGARRRKAPNLVAGRRVDAINNAVFRACDQPLKIRIERWRTYDRAVCLEPPKRLAQQRSFPAHWKARIKARNAMRDRALLRMAAWRAST